MATRGETTLLHDTSELGVEPERVAWATLGGGMAAALTVLVYEPPARIARQILLMPMLDDRPGPRPAPRALRAVVL